MSRQKTEVAPGSFFFLQGNQLTHQLQLQYLWLSPSSKFERVYKISLHTKIQLGNISSQLSKIITNFSKLLYLKEYASQNRKEKKREGKRERKGKTNQNQGLHSYTQGTSLPPWVMFGSHAENYFCGS